MVSSRFYADFLIAVYGFCAGDIMKMKLLDIDWENVKYIEASLGIPSDHLPVLEPWFGTGIFANMYGCPYVWRDGEAPAVRYRYLSINDIRGISRSKWQDSGIAQLILETIRYFKSKTGDALCFSSCIPSVINRHAS